MTGQPAMPTRASGRLALFLPDLPLGGVERVFANLAVGFADVGLDVDMVAADASGIGRQMFPPRTEYVDLGAARTLRALAPLIRYLRTTRPDVLISGKDHANIIAILAGRLAKVPVVATVHSQPSRAWRDPERSTGRALPGLARLVYPRAAAVIAVSEGVAEDLVRLGVTGSRVIPNPIISADTAARAAAPASHPWLVAERPTPVVVWCGRIAVEKDPITAVEAVADASGIAPMRLLFVGDGPLVGAVTSRARELGLEQSVDVVGPVADALPFLARADAVLLTSRREALPTVLVEALSVGAHVVATDCETGPRRILRDGQLGRLVPVADPKAIGQGLVDELASPRREIPDDALSDYSIVTAIDRYLGVLVGVSAVRRRENQ